MNRNALTLMVTMAATLSCHPAPGVRSMSPLSLQQLKDEFNKARRNVRVVAILSPTCEMCQSGHHVMKDIFSKSPSKKLKGFLVWLPMLSGDNSTAASDQAATLKDKRLVAEGWDHEKLIGRQFAEALNLRGTAWDVYLIYAPGIEWVESAPPKPTFWMHQLKNADPRLRLNPTVFFGRLHEELSRL